jgi:hypothetical protein
VYVKAGRTGEAIRLWQGALERSPGLLALNPTNAMARKLLGEVRLKR